MDVVSDWGELVIPLRPDGTPKAFFYHREGDHIIHRQRDGGLVAIGFDCRHVIEEE